MSLSPPPWTCTVAGESACSSVSLLHSFTHSSSYTSPLHSQVVYSLPEKGEISKALPLPEKGKSDSKAYSLPGKGKSDSKAYSLPGKGISRYLPAELKGLCIINPSGTAEAMPKFSADHLYTLCSHRNTSKQQNDMGRLALLPEEHAPALSAQRLQRKLCPNFYLHKLHTSTQSTG